ncbi:MAG: FG-GAP-like repeat-containing protein [Gammaproteobacteria bacterium]
MARRNGSSKDDDLKGGAQSDFLVGLGGNDEMNGGAGDDRLSGGLGEDNLIGGSGEDLLVGGGGDDRMNGGASADTLNGGKGDDVALGGNGDDDLEGGDGRDFLVGGAGDDQLAWDPDDLRVDGGVGFDTLDVTAGRAVLGAQTRLRNIEAIDLRGGGANTLALDAAAVINATDSRRLLRIFGDTNDSVELDGTWSRVRSPVAGFTRYVSGSAKVDVADTLDVLYGNRLNVADLNGVNGFHVAGAHTLSAQGGDVNGDGLDDLLLGAPLNPRDTTGGAAYLLYGKANSTAAEIDVEHLRARQGMRFTAPKSEQYAGIQVAIVGDVNHDGLDDVSISSTGFDAAFSASTVKNYVVFGERGGLPGNFFLPGVNGDNGYFFDDLSFHPLVDRVLVAAAGDFNGDGFEDFTLSVPGFGDAGSTYLVRGAAQPYDRSVFLLEEGWRIDGAGSTIVAGDFNGDGFDDLGTGSLPRSHVLFGSATGFETPANLLQLNGNDGLALTGQSFTGAMAMLDLNGDGFDDLVSGERYAGQHVTRVLFGRESGLGSSIGTSNLNGSFGFTILTPPAEKERISLAAAGDVNGDGYEDLLIGAPYANGSRPFHAGAVYVVFGHGGDYAPSLNLAQLTPEQGLRIDGFVRHQRIGFSVGSAGDLNGDGFDDIVVAGPSSGGPAGGSFVIYGRDFTHQVDKLGGPTADTLIGTAADESLVGGRGRDLLDGAGGSDALLGGANDDVLVWDALDRRVDGAAGFDTLRFSGANETLDLTLLPSRVVTGINAVDLTGSGDNQLRLSLQDLLQLTDNAALRVLGDAGDSLTMTTSGWTQLSNQSLGGVSYRAYLNGSVTLLVDTDVSATVA